MGHCVAQAGNIYIILVHQHKNFNMKTLRTITNSLDITETNTVKVNRQTQGNYFVMDSEQVVSNPYQDLQAEAVDSVKKVSLTERLTSVRNNVCEHHLRTTTTNLDQQRKYSLRNLHMDSSNLRYEAKVMDINKRRNDLMMQRRIDPDKDFSYDTRQINNSAKRLGVTNEKSYYLDKELQYPLRSSISKDHNSKPFIKKARKTMQSRCTQKKIEKHEAERVQTANTLERTATAQSMSTSIEIPSPEPSTKEATKTHIRGGSKSAPPQKNSADAHRSQFDEPDSKLPSINTTGLGTNTRATKSHVKFEEPTQLRQSTPSSLHRSKTFTSGVTTRRPSYHKDIWDSDSDDDYSYCEKVDLRALFFGDKSQNADSKSANSRTATPRTMCTRMSSEMPLIYRSKSAQPVKEEQIIKENQELRVKIDKFLETLPDDEKPPKKEEKPEEKKDEKQPDKDEIKDNEKEKAMSKMSVAAKAAYMLSVFSKPLDRRLMWGGPMYRPPQTQESNSGNLQADFTDHNEEDDKPKKKEMWELIQTNNGNVRKKYSANDLLLQQLTGILVQSDKKTSIPIHSASRALRHTPTFKMRRVVEELMRQRTRYEQQEIDKLQQQEEGGEVLDPGQEDYGGVQHYQPAQAWASPSRQFSQEIN